MMHRGTARAVKQHLEDCPFRPMFKLQFLRTADPGLTPSWAHDPEAVAALPSFEDLAGPLAPACKSVWEWMRGNKSPEPVASLTDHAVASLGRDLALVGPHNEAARVSAAVQLARDCWNRDGRSLVPLLQALTDETCEARMRAAMHALGLAGDAAVPALIDTLVTPCSPLVAARAAEALGEAATVPTQAAIAALCELAVRTESDIAAASPTIDWRLPSKGGNSNFLLETFQLPLCALSLSLSLSLSLQLSVFRLPIEQREAAARWLTIKSCVDSLGVFGQRAVARGDGKLCLSLAQTLVGFLGSVCPPVRHSAAIGLTCEFSQTYGRILTVVLHINGVPCCWEQALRRRRRCAVSRSLYCHRCSPPTRIVRRWRTTTRAGRQWMPWCGSSAAGGARAETNAPRQRWRSWSRHVSPREGSWGGPQNQNGTVFEGLGGQ